MKEIAACLSCCGIHVLSFGIKDVLDKELENFLQKIV